MLPEKSSQTRLQSSIRQLSLALSSPQFDSHVTLLSPLWHEQEHTLHLMQQLAESTPPLALEPTGFAFQACVYQALYIELPCSTGLLRLREKAQQAFGCSPIEKYLPHLSLAYLDPTLFDQAACLQSLDTSLLQPLRFDRLAWIATPAGPESWQTLYEVKLHEQ